MSGLAVFGLKYPSLLKFDEQRHKKRIRANLRSLYGVAQAPCDTQLRTVLDGVSPTELRAPFIHLHQQLKAQGVLDKYGYLGGFWSTSMGRVIFLLPRSIVPTAVKSTIGMVRSSIIINY